MHILEQNLSQNNPKSIINQPFNPFNNPNNFPSYATLNQINMFPNLQNPMNNNLPPGMTPPFTFQIFSSGLPTTILNKSELQKQINELEELQEEKEEMLEQLKQMQLIVMPHRMIQRYQTLKGEAILLLISLLQLCIKKKM